MFRARGLKIVGFQRFVHFHAGFGEWRRRRVDRTAQLAHSVNVQDAVKRLKDALPKIPSVRKTPPPDVEIIDFNTRGPVLAVRAYAHTDHYWQVYFDTNRTIRETFGAAGYPAAETHHYVRRVG